MIPQTLNIDNVRTASANFVNLDTIKKLIKCSSKSIGMFTLSVFEILLFEGRSVLSADQRGTRNKRVKVSVKN